MRKLVIDANKKGINLNLRELFNYKDLFLVMAYRDLRVRYAQTFLGFAWAIIQPLATLCIFTFVFGKAVKVDTGDIPYPLFAISGTVAWSYFSFVLSNSGSSIVGSQEMVKKIYFPRLIIPLSKAVVGLVDFGITFFLLILALFIYGIVPSGNIIFLPFFIFMCALSALSVGIWVSALTIRYRDFNYMVPFLVQFGLYATPVGYPSELVINRLPQWATIAFYLNPLTGVVEGFRWSILGSGQLSGYSFFSFAVVLVLFISSLYYFKSVERIMADII